MKHVKTYENTNSDRFVKFVKEKTQLYRDINEYLYNIGYKDVETTDVDYFTVANEKVIDIFYVDSQGETQSITLNNQTAQNLMDFLDNTELHRTAKKYNI